MNAALRVMVCPECSAAWLRRPSGEDPFDGRCPKCSNEASVMGNGGPFEAELVEACGTCGGTGYVKPKARGRKRAKAELDPDHPLEAGWTPG